MHAYHSDAPANTVLNILDRECRSAVLGIEQQVLQFKWNLRGQPAEALQPAVQRLCQEGLLRPVAHWLRLTSAGYARLTASAVERLAEPADAPVQEGPLTEYQLRARVLGLFRAAGASAGDRVAAAELERYWQVSQARATDLRLGLNLLLRDGLVKLGRFNQTLFRLEHAGHDYLSGREAPPWLAEFSPPVDAAAARQAGIPQLSLCVLAAHQFRGRSEAAIAVAELDYLLERHQLPGYARAHAMDLVHRLGYADADEGLLGLSLTAAADELLRLGESEVVQWSIKNDLRRITGDSDD